MSRSPKSVRRVARLLAPVLVLPAAALAGAATAQAYSAVYQVTGADSQGLANLTKPYTGGTNGSQLLRWFANGTNLTVVCQVNNGEQEDGRTQYGHAFTTWDQLSDGTYVYDWYMNTPTVATNGYSPGIPACGSGSVSIGNDYPSSWQSAGKDSFATSWGYNRECVSYAAWELYRLNGGRQTPTGTGSGSIPSDWSTYSINVDATYGNAGDWGSVAKANGIAVNNTPTVGSIAWWTNGGNNGTFTVGHVAVVTKVYSDGSVDLAQYNLREDGLYSTLHIPANGSAVDTSNGHGAFTVYWPNGFIHFNGR